jgi:hypothetical protein
LRDRHAEARLARIRSYAAREGQRAARSTDLIAAHCGSAGACSQMLVCTSKEVHDVGAIAIVPNVGDAYDNALAESFLDSYKTELIADRVWTSRVQLELATVEWVAWFNHDRLHSALGDIPPVEFEQRQAATIALIAVASGDESLAAISPKPADGLTTKRASTTAVDFVVDRLTGSPNAPDARALTAQAAPHASRR